MPSPEKYPAYRKFINDRNGALEHLLLKRKIKTARFTQQAIDKILGYLMHKWPMIDLKLLEGSIDQLFHQTGMMCLAEQIQHRKHVTMLTKVSQAVALRSVGVDNKIRLERYQLEDSARIGVRDLALRMEYSFGKLKRDIIDAVHFSIVRKLDTAAMVDKVKSKLPKVVTSRQALRKVTKITEAEKLLKPNIDIDVIDEAEWQSMLSEYMANIPRPYKSKVGDLVDQMDVDDVEAEELKWQLEQDLMADFVHRVRDGENETAKEMGVEDFVWVAVVDNRTDECCLWRDGLLVSEIEAKLNKGKDDSCLEELGGNVELAATVPLHPNCRCYLAPALPNLPDKVNFDAGEFSQWLRD